MILSAHSNENHSSPCTTIRVFETLLVSVGVELLFGNKCELDYSLRLPKARNENENEVVGMGGNGYTRNSFPHISIGNYETRYI